MKKQFLVLLLTIFILVSVTGCVGAQKKSDPLVIGVLPNLDSIPMIIAQEKGYFDSDKIKIEYFKSAIDRDTALQTGNLDGTASDLLSAVFLNDNDFDVKITSKTEGAFVIVSSPKTSIASVDDINEATIAISSNTVIEYLTDRFIESNNLNALSKTSIPQMPTRLEMLQNGKITLATLPEPLATSALLNGGAFITSSDDIGSNPSVILFSSTSISEKEALIKDFYIAYNKAVDYIDKTPISSYIDVVISVGGFPENTKENFPLQKYSPASLPDPKELTYVNEWMLSKGLTENKYNFADITIDKFIK